MEQQMQNLRGEQAWSPAGTKKGIVAGMELVRERGLVRAI